MKTVAQAIGYAYLLATALAMLDLMDMQVCVGKVGACNLTISKPAKGPTV